MRITRTNVGRNWRDFLAVVGILGLVVVGIIIVWIVPKHQVELYGTITSSDEKRAMLEDAFRKTLSQIVLSVFGILLIYFTWRRTRAAESTLGLTEQSDITDRYTKAIEQLGKMNDGEQNLEVRLGAIYALGSIAEDSARYHWPIMEVLTAYVRKNAALDSDQSYRDKYREEPRIDIQAVLTILGGRDASRENRPSENRSSKERANQQYLDLRKCYLCGAKLNGGDFRNADLEHTNLKAAVFKGAKLQKACLRKANLHSTNFYEANLMEAYFTDAVLDAANLDRAQISNAIDLTREQKESAKSRVD
jgi:Pentapeptide repeats (8 copies)